MGLIVNSTDYLVRTAGLPTGQFTLTWWSMLTTDQNTYTPQWMLWESGFTNPRYVQCGSTIDGTSFVAEVHNSTSNGGGWVDTGVLANVSANVWYFWALTLSAFTGSFTLNGYVRAVTATALTSGTVNSTWTGTFAPDNFHLGHESPYGGYFNGRIANFKMWNSVLSSAEILAESFNLEPVMRTNLRSYWHLYNSSYLQDYGPNGNNWAPNFFNPVETAGPPIPLHRKKVYIPATYGSPPPPTANRRRRVLIAGASS